MTAPNLDAARADGASAGGYHAVGRSTMRSYSVPLAGMLAATLIGEGLRYIHAGHSALTITYLVPTLASAWWGGYGPGVVACLFGLLVAPYFFNPGFSVMHVDVARTVLVLLVSVLISRVADGRRRTEQALREANEKLDARVRERTEELQKSNADLSRLNEALNEFSYSVSHDLQQPLRMITLYAQLLERNFRSELNSDGNEYVGLILSGARQMKLLLEDLLAYSRSVHAPNDNIGRVDANAVLSKVLLNLKDELQETQAVVEAAHLPTLSIHEFHLTEVLQNLVSNAIKYRSEERPLIHIGAEPSEDHWKFWVSDNGIGIAPEYAKQVFGLFKRLHSTDSYEGTGVGLAICERIVERYDGEIWVEPRSPRGSTFYFTIRAETTGGDAERIQASTQPALGGEVS
ncbi:MAG: ATP-binding protein [Bryobacteraceae bacterium]